VASRAFFIDAHTKESAWRTRRGNLNERVSEMKAKERGPVRPETVTHEKGFRIVRGIAHADPNIEFGWALADEAHLRARTLTGGKQIPTRRPATPEDIERLTGTPEHPDVPFGLERCEHCGGWQGECLLSGPSFDPIVIFVRCVCHKQLRCETCGKLRFEQLPGLPGSYYYNEEMRTIAHIPTFAALIEHRCRAGGK
jgi:hypothetical protein